MGGEEHDGDRRVPRADGVEQAEAVEARHAQVGEHEVDRVGLEVRERRVGVCGRVHREPGLQEQGLQHGQQRGVVVDDQDLLGHGASVD